MPSIFFAVSLLGLCFTLNAIRPSSRWQFIAPSFFAGWLTSELAGIHLAWQILATIAFVAFGALDSWIGYVALAITFVSWAGLVWLISVSMRSGHVIEDALRAALGNGYRDEIAPGRAQRLSARTSRRGLLFPFYLRDRRVRRIRNIRYAEGAGKRHLLDVYQPKPADAHGPSKKMPVLLQIHGGAWMIGDKSQQGLPLMLHLAAEGWVCVANNYRLSPKATFPDHLVDCKQALAWVREHIEEYGGDPDFIVVTGGSAGGHLAALVALTANDPQYQPGFEDADTSVAACVPFYGVYDLVAEIGTSPADEWLANRVMKTSLADGRELYESGSPTLRAHADAPTFFVIHGDRDNIAAVSQAREFVTVLRAVSQRPVAYAEIEGGSHAFDVFHSIRTGNAVNGVDRFLAWVYSAYEASLLEQGIDPPDPEVNPVEPEVDPTSVGDTPVNGVAASVEAAAGGS